MRRFLLSYFRLVMALSLLGQLVVDGSGCVSRICAFLWMQNLRMKKKKELKGNCREREREGEREKAETKGKEIITGTSRSVDIFM